MTTNHLELLINLSEKKTETVDYNQPYDILIHSVLNTVNFHELILDFVNNVSKNLNNSILSNIEKRVFSCSYEQAEKIYENLKEIIELKVDYQKSQRIRKILELLLSVLDKDYKIDFFNTFFYSKYSNDKKSAIKYIDYCEDINEEELLGEYFASLNIQFLIPIMKDDFSVLLSKNIQDIWYEEIPFFAKKRLIELVAKVDISKLNFLQDIEFDLFLLASLVAKKITAKKALKKLYKIEESKRHFALFNISKEIEFSEIEKEIKKYIS